MIHSRRTVLSVLVPVLTAFAVAVVALAWPTSPAVAKKVKAVQPVQLVFHFANLPAGAGGTVDITSGVQAIPGQRALSASPGTMKLFVASQQGFLIVAADNAPLSADITFTPEPTGFATAYSGVATVPAGATLTVKVGSAAPKQIANGTFTIPLTTLGKKPKH